jgi:uncharacterized repeat protein (TIGR03803 family)
MDEMDATRNGAIPQSFGPSLVPGADGNLYGTTAHGGANSDGMVFKLTPSGTLTTRYSFCSRVPCADEAGTGFSTAQPREAGTSSTEPCSASVCLQPAPTPGRSRANTAPAAQIHRHPCEPIVSVLSCNPSGPRPCVHHSAGGARLCLGRRTQEGNGRRVRSLRRSRGDSS